MRPKCISLSGSRNIHFLLASTGGLMDLDTYDQW